MEINPLNLEKTKKSSAFTLIELLVVIAIIGIIAALVSGLVGKAATSRKIGRVKVELAQLETAIDSYKEKKGFYPPSNTDTNNAVTNQLFYELTGTIFDNFTFQTINGTEKIQDSDLDVFGDVKGFANSATTENRSELKNFFPGLKSSQYFAIHPKADVSVELLIVPVEGPNDIEVYELASDGQLKLVKKINPWRYNSAAPTHNPESYDLWAEIVVGGRTNIIGNWKE